MVRAMSDANYTHVIIQFRNSGNHPGILVELFDVESAEDTLEAWATKGLRALHFHTPKNVLVFNAGEVLVCKLITAIEAQEFRNTEQRLFDESKEQINLQRARAAEIHEAQMNAIKSARLSAGSAILR